VVTDQGLIEGMSLPVYRRIASIIFVRALTQGGSSIEMMTIDPFGLQAAFDREAPP